MHGPFLLLYGVAVAGMFFIWIVILLAHLAFCRSVGHARVALLPILLPFPPYSQIAALIAFVAITLSTFYVEWLQYTVPGFMPVLLVITAFYWVLKRSKGS